MLQSGHRPFALAAEHGCVEMLEIQMEPYNMATMKPNKVCAAAAALLVHLHTVNIRLFISTWT